MTTKQSSNTSRHDTLSSFQAIIYTMPDRINKTRYLCGGYVPIPRDKDNAEKTAVFLNEDEPNNVERFTWTYRTIIIPEQPGMYFIEVHDDDTGAYLGRI